MSRYHDDRGFASDPGRISLSNRKMRLLHPELFGVKAAMARLSRPFTKPFPWLDVLAEHVAMGDSRAALLMCANPLLVAAYSDELDCVAMLRFPEEVLDGKDLRLGSRLLTINTYKVGRAFDADLIAGPGYMNRYSGFHPVIADFASDDMDPIRDRIRSIDEEEWQRTTILANQYIARNRYLARDGRPRLSSIPAVPKGTSVSKMVSE